MENVWQLRGDNPKQGYLLVILHGRGDSPNGWITFLDELKIPNLSAYLLVAPDKIGQGFSWYSSAPHQLPGITRSRGHLENVFKDILQRGFDPKKIFLMGFSQGCLMTLEFGARYQHRLAGYIGLSGYCYDPEALIQETKPEIKTAPWFIVHGTNDDVLPFERTKEQVEALIAGGFNIDFREYPIAHEFDDIHEARDLKQWLLKITT